MNCRRRVKWIREILVQDKGFRYANDSRYYTGIFKGTVQINLLKPILITTGLQIKIVIFVLHWHYRRIIARNKSDFSLVILPIRTFFNIKAIIIHFRSGQPIKMHIVFIYASGKG